MAMKEGISFLNRTLYPLWHYLFKVAVLVKRMTYEPNYQVAEPKYCIFYGPCSAAADL